MKLFLDDIRQPPDDTWTVARSYEEGMSLVQQYGFPAEVSFDHDLGTGPTGMNFAHYLIALDLDDNTMPSNFKYTVHSANPIGAKNIEALLDQYIQWKRG